MLCAILGGCASLSAPVVGVLSDAFSEIAADDSQKVLSAVLRPDFEYLKVQAPGRPAALLVLGYVDAHPLGAIEVWYSSSREVIKLQNGRIVGTAGLVLDWRSVFYPVAPPPWLQITQTGNVSAHYERVRDVMPGYRTSAIEHIDVLAAQPPPELTKSMTLSPTAQNFIWMQERVATVPNGTTPSLGSLPDAWFALGPQPGRGQVRVSYQCLSSDMCFTLQRWPAESKKP